MFRFVILAVLVSFTGATTVSPCTYPLPQPDAVRISGCSAEPCQFVKGTIIDLEIDFTVPTLTTTLTGYLSYTVFGLTFQYDLPPGMSNVCANLKNGVTCPLDAQESATYAISIDTSGYPTVSAKLKASMKDQNNVVLGCFTVQVSLVNP